jgi:hypothetical protein
MVIGETESHVAQLSPKSADVSKRVSKTENRAYAEKQYSDHFRRFDREQLKSHMLLGNCNTSLYRKNCNTSKGGTSNPHAGAETDARERNGYLSSPPKARSKGEV